MKQKNKQSNTYEEDGDFFLYNSEQDTKEVLDSLGLNSVDNQSYNKYDQYSSDTY